MLNLSLVLMHRIHTNTKKNPNKKSIPSRERLKLILCTLEYFKEKKKRVLYTIGSNYKHIKCLKTQTDALNSAKIPFQFHEFTLLMLLVKVGSVIGCTTSECLRMWNLKHTQSERWIWEWSNKDDKNKNKMPHCSSSSTFSSLTRIVCGNSVTAHF